MPAVRVPANSQSPVSGRCKISILSAAVALALGIVSVDASALAFGRLNVQSALGEPLRAEIEVTEAQANEIADLKVRLASSEAFRAAGVPYNAALSDVRVNLQRRADGRYVVRLSSNRQLSEPFLDLLVEANWSSGRIVRDYTVLLDPPRSRNSAAAAPVAPIAPQIAAAAPAQRALPPAAQPPISRPRPASVAPAPVDGGTARAEGGEQQQVTVQRGDTAGKIAGANKPADVSLDQMLVAMLRANPSAFIDGNINRIKAGAVLDMPAASQASAIPAAEARRTVVAQSRNFNEYRRRLAENAPASRVPDADRQASGKLEANVEDRNAANASADKLKITQSGAAGSKADEELAKARQAQDSSARVAELSKNIGELNKLQAASGASAAGDTAPAPVAAASPPGAATPSSSPAAPAPGASAPALAGIPAPAGTAAATGTTPPQTATPPETTAPAAATPAPAPAAARPAVPITPERGFLAELLDNPLMLGIAALIALLVAFLLYRVLGRKRYDATDSVFLESRLPKDSFFGATGGESVDTKDRGNSVISSLSYSPSQLDAGDVDPVAEADVYLAYGRDLQAEEILREALRVNPERTAIHVKLLEIHAKRRDVRAFEALANDVRKLTGGTGGDWSRVAEMGKELDPANTLYDVDDNNTPTPGEAAAFAGTLAAATHAPAAPAPKPLASRDDPVDAAPPAFVPSVIPLDFDLDLGKPPVPAPSAPSPVVANLPETKTQPDPFPSTLREPKRPASAAAPTSDVDAMLSPTVRLDLHNDFDTAPGALEAPTERVPLMPDNEKTQPATLRAGLPGDSGFIEFDMSSLAGLSGRTSTDTERAGLESLEDSGESPHVIKLSLARELKALGDVEGARSLVEEVAAESSGDVKAEAKQLLVQLR